MNVGALQTTQENTRHRMIPTGHAHADRNGVRFAVAETMGVRMYLTPNVHSSHTAKPKPTSPDGGRWLVSTADDLEDCLAIATWIMYIVSVSGRRIVRGGDRAMN